MPFCAAATVATTRRSGASFCSRSETRDRRLRCVRRHPQYRLPRAVLYALQSGHAASVLASVAAPGTLGDAPAVLRDAQVYGPPGTRQPLDYLAQQIRSHRCRHGDTCPLFDRNLDLSTSYPVHPHLHRMFSACNLYQGRATILHGSSVLSINEDAEGPVSSNPWCSCVVHSDGRSHGSMLPIISLTLVSPPCPQSPVRGMPSSRPTPSVLDAHEHARCA